MSSSKGESSTERPSATRRPSAISQSSQQSTHYTTDFLRMLSVLQNNEFAWPFNVGLMRHILGQMAYLRELLPHQWDQFNTAQVFEYVTKNIAGLDMNRIMLVDSYDRKVAIYAQFKPIRQMAKELHALGDVEVEKMIPSMEIVAKRCLRRESNCDPFANPTVVINGDPNHEAVLEELLKPLVTAFQKIRADLPGRVNNVLYFSEGYLLNGRGEVEFARWVRFEAVRLFTRQHFDTSQGVGPEFYLRVASWRKSTFEKTLISRASPPCVVMEDIQIFAEKLNAYSVVFSIDPDIPVRDILANINITPLAIICQTIDMSDTDFDDMDGPDPNSPRVQQMTNDYIHVPWDTAGVPALENLSMYVRKF